jgi:hypothetical protein
MMTIMKKIGLISVSALLLLSSCGTYTGMGAYTGGTFGSIIGSAIGGISGGRHGSNVGTLIGMAGGAVVGAAVGAAADNARQRDLEQYEADRQQRMENRQRRMESRQHNYDSQSQSNYDQADNSGFDPSGSGDDRLYGFGEDFGTSPALRSDKLADIEIRHARIMDASRNGELTRGEEARMVFEVYNNSSEPAYQVQPSVAEITGNKHIRVSENVLVECIPPGKGIRYTAVIKADDRLKDGEAVIRIGVFQSDKEIASQTQEFRIKTSKR